MSDECGDRPAADLLLSTTVACVVPLRRPQTGAELGHSAPQLQLVERCNCSLGSPVAMCAYRVLPFDHNHLLSHHLAKASLANKSWPRPLAAACPLKAWNIYYIIFYGTGMRYILVYSNTVIKGKNSIQVSQISTVPVLITVLPQRGEAPIEISNQYGACT